MAFCVFIYCTDTSFLNDGSLKGGKWLHVMCWAFKMSSKGELYFYNSNPAHDWDDGASGLETK